MQDLPNKPSLIVVLVALCCVPLGWGCQDGGGGDGPPQADVVALDLETGDRQLFEDADAVPEGWALCEDARCLLPPEFPCQVLGSGACLLSAQCRLKLRCEFDLSAYGIASAQSVPPGATPPDATPPDVAPQDDPTAPSTGGGAPDEPVAPPQIAGAPAGCEFVCTVNATQRSCDEIREQRVCDGRPDCNWDWIRIGALPDGIGDVSLACGGDDCVPAPVGYCRPSEPPRCEELDQRSCFEREECVWSPAECPLFCRDADCETACAPFCQPRAEPEECPAIAHVIPDCREGQPVPEYDDRGCVVGYRCDSICPPAPLGMPYCPDGKVEQIRDQNDCVIGYGCVNECPSVPEPGFECPFAHRVVPRYDPSGCVVEFDCIGEDRCDELGRTYAEVLREAKSCLPFAQTVGGDSSSGPEPGLVAQCSLTVPDSLGCPACPTFVNASQGEAVDKLSRLRSEFDRLDCSKDMLCPMVACALPQGAGCLPGVDGFTGYCADGRRAD